MCVCVGGCGCGQGDVDGGMWGWVCGCVNEVCKEVTGCGDGCVGGGCVSEFWTSCIVYMLILTISMRIVCLTQFGQKVG